MPLAVQVAKLTGSNFDMMVLFVGDVISGSLTHLFVETDCLYSKKVSVVVFYAAATDFDCHSVFDTFEKEDFGSHLKTFDVLPTNGMSVQRCILCWCTVGTHMFFAHCFSAVRS